MAVTVSTTQPGQYIQDLLTREETGLFPQLSASLDSPYQQYAGPRVAGFTQDQLDAFGKARASVGATDPNEARASQLLDESYAALTGGGEQAQQLLQQSMGAGNDWLTKALGSAETLTSQGNPLMSEAKNLIMGSAVGPTGEDIGRYMDPFQSNVIDTTMAELNRQFDIDRQGRDAAAVNAGAFGGGRHGVMEAEAGRNMADVKARTLAQLMSSNYGQALNAAQQEKQMQGQAGSLATALGSSDANVRENAIRSMMTGGGSLSDIFLRGSGQQAGLAGQQAGGIGDLATKELGLGSFVREQDMADIQNLYNMGQRQQGQDQAVLDVGFQDFLSQRAYEDPRAKVQFMSDIIRGAPSGSQTMSQTYQDPMSPLQAIAGIAPLAMAFI